MPTIQSRDSSTLSVGTTARASHFSRLRSRSRSARLRLPRAPPCSPSSRSRSRSLSRSCCELTRPWRAVRWVKRVLYRATRSAKAGRPGLWVEGVGEWKARNERWVWRVVTASMSCLRVRAVAAVRVERRESRLHADDWLGAGVRFEEVARVRVLELVGVLDGALVERRARDGVRGSERGTTTRPTTARSLSARPAGTKTSTSTPVPARDTPTTRPAAPQPSHLSTSPFSTSSPSPSTPASAPSARAPAATVAPSKPLKPHRRPLQAGCDALHAVGDRGSASRPRPLPSAARHAHVDPPWLQCVPLLPSLVVEELIADS